ncbi:fungal-specific transcription factor domain-containing protein [Aspergillus carlsbadensis]|nr:fungal-specific transcription factor domain-containing protein [Aspergillus carlsbadensis]
MSDPAEATAKRTSTPVEDDHAPKRRAARACVYCRHRKTGWSASWPTRFAPGASLTRGARRAAFMPTVSPQAKKSLITCYSVREYGESTIMLETHAKLSVLPEPPGMSRENVDRGDMGPSPTSHRPADNLYTHHSTPPGNNKGVPQYIKHLPPHITGDDVEYLAKKDALTIPDDSLRNALLMQYIRAVHPLMPILELDDFMTPILRDDGMHQVSLLLFQAVMFAGVGFVELEMLRAHGYTCRRSARKHFFRRVRLLYGLDCEADRPALVQALLLMTYWYDKPGDEKDTWYWMGVALSLAQVMGLHRDPEQMQLGLKAKRHRRRLWWACFMRDRVLALGIRRPARIRPGDFNVSMLAVEDLDPELVSDELVALLGAWGSPADVDARRTLATLCIELARLCLCVGRILLSQYSVLEHQGLDSRSTNAVMVFPRAAQEQLHELATCDEELNQWVHSLSPSPRYAVQYSGPSDQASALDDTVALHRASLYMTYLMAVGALHRPQVFSTPCAVVDAESSPSVSRQRVSDAAVALTQLAYDIQVRGHVRYLTPSGIAAFTSAALVHLLDTRSTREELQEIYTSADYAVYFLDRVIRKAQIQLPLFDGWSRQVGRAPQGQSMHARVPFNLSERTYPTPSSSIHPMVAEGISYPPSNSDTTRYSAKNAPFDADAIAFDAPDHAKLEV